MSSNSIIESGQNLHSTELSNNTIDTILSLLGTESLNISSSLQTVDYVQSKIEEFSNLFNGLYRVSILNCNPSQRESLIYPLIALKKNIKYALEDLGKSLTTREYKFRCGTCDEQLKIEPGKDIWSSLQNHEHFEELYYKFLTNDMEITTLEEKSIIPGMSESDSNNLEDTTTGGSNTDSGIDQQEMEPSTSGTQKLTLTSPKKYSMDSEENVNNFRFNFNVSYDEAVESKIYPSGMMLGVRRYDKVKEYTLQRAGNSKAVCLICHCEINAMRVSKHMLVNHTMGQKHLKSAVTPEIIDMLQFYHNFWLKQDTIIQAHQVYFRPYTIPNFKCALCHGTFNSDQVILHIVSDIHRNKVLEMFEKRTNLYFLINLQIQVYGITQEQYDAHENEIKKKEEVKVRERRRKKNSDSDTPDEARKLASKPNSIKHDIIRSVEISDSSDPLDRLPNRMKSDVKLLKRIVSDGFTVIHCSLCKKNIQNNVGAIENHIVFSAPHNSGKKEKYSYYCEICNVRVMNETGWKNHNFSGPRHVNMAASRKANVTEYECTTCKTVIFGDELSLTRHLAVGNRGKREKGLPEPIKGMFQSKDHIFTKAAQLTGDAEEVLANSLTKDCCTRIESALAEHFDACAVYPFGSRISGIGNKASDLDVFVDTGNMYYGEDNQDPTEQVKIIRKAAKAFSKNKEYLNIVQVLTARTPILKLHHIPTKLDCDLSFKHGLSVENTKFLRHCIELQPTIQPVIMLVKKWAEHVSFENITTYALAVMCIFYLQVNGYLLSVEKLRKINKTEPKVINGWKTISYDLTLEETKSHVKPYEKTVFELLKGFFEYYVKFDFNFYVVCPLLGRVVKRTAFSEHLDELPAEMDDYVTKLEGEDPEVFKSTSYMCIQDPFDLSHNLTKAAQQGTQTKFQNMCKMSVAYLESIK